jgi:ABC-type uncharacterized transport system involved in gliding motility auxiliary subunit
MSTLQPSGEHYAIAARVTGTAATAFPSGPPIDMTPPAPGTSPPPAFPSQVKKGALNVLIMADSDIFDDRFWVRVENLYGKQIAAPFADNAAFVLSAVGNLTGSDDLISLRTRATNDRPFTVVRDLQARAQAQYRQEGEALQQRLTDTEQRLNEVQGGGTTNGKPSTGTALTSEQRAAVERFRKQLVETRGELRDVQRNLRRDIDVLGNVLAFFNVALIPLLVVIGAVILAAIRRRRRRPRLKPAGQNP